ncbi:MAG: glycoside hydrolase family 15 protein [Fimbriimonadaceae bacterium]|nr:glycoside hydrolase family 15 protein [Fimbriimonadaceae bacterium]
MPRSLLLSNGSLALAYDDRYQLRELTYPHVGYLNHLLGHPCRFGVWRDGQFFWTSDHSWEIVVAGEGDPWRPVSTLRNATLGILLTITETVSPFQHERFIRVEDIAGRGTPARLFLHHAPMMEECDHGNTAYYWREVDAMIHYRGKYNLLVSGDSNCGGLVQKVCGITRFDVKEGTWRDAEDGELQGELIAQGSVDTVFRLDVDLTEMQGWARTRLAIAELVSMFLINEEDGRYSQFDQNGECDQPWRPKGMRSECLRESPDRWARHFNSSLHVLNAHHSGNGAIIAALDSDIMLTNRAHYAYCWPRDAAHICEVTQKTMGQDLTKRFIKFAGTLGAIVVSPRLFARALQQKYRPDGHLGASWHPYEVRDEPVLPIQSDETAATAQIYCDHIGLDPNLDEMGQGWLSFLCEFVDETGLPQPSWDLWEERRGVHAYTVATTISALRRAAQAFNHEGYEDVANRMEEAWLLNGTNPETGVPYRSLLASEQGLVPDATPDAAILAAALINDPGKEQLKRIRDFVVEHLTVHSPIGGIARNSHDYYFRQSGTYPGNPWVITTMWVAQADIRLGDLASAEERLDWACRLATPSGYFPEQLHPETGAPLSVQPLAWSHAEFVRTVLAYDAAASQ